MIVNMFLSGVGKVHVRQLVQFSWEQAQPLPIRLHVLVQAGKMYILLFIFDIYVIMNLMIVIKQQLIITMANKIYTQ